MLIDEAKITFKAGHGGAGKASFYPGKDSGPDGGNGGRGGDLYIVAVNDITALNQFSGKTSASADNGEPGDKNKKSGKDGLDLEVSLPLGATLTNGESGEIIELTVSGQRLLLCKGGKGGKGNYELRSSRNTTPMRAQKGLPGQEWTIQIILRLIAEFGLIGLPNTGKSSLLNALTSAQAKVADYSFTTLEPNLGVFKGRVIADIPGLIEGASQGKGLGIKFLKHIEKVRVLLHCIAADSTTPFEDYQTVVKEMQEYNPELLLKEQVLLLTKSDMAVSADIESKITMLKKLGHQILPVSILDDDSIGALEKLLKKKYTST